MICSSLGYLGGDEAQLGASTQSREERMAPELGQSPWKWEGRGLRRQISSTWWWVAEWGQGQKGIWMPVRTVLSLLAMGSPKERQGGASEESDFGMGHIRNESPGKHSRGELKKERLLGPSRGSRWRGRGASAAGANCLREKSGAWKEALRPPHSAPVSGWKGLEGRGVKLGSRRAPCYSKQGRQVFLKEGWGVMLNEAEFSFWREKKNQNWLCCLLITNLPTTFKSLNSLSWTPGLSHTTVYL